MNYRDILEAAFAALKDEGKTINEENETGQAKIDGQAGQQTVTDTATETDALASRTEPAVAAVKAAELIKRIKRQASAATQDLDVTRAKELDGLADILDEFCEIFRSGF